ncbi:MAG TPA: hypothetical protein VK589_16985, partial [Chryseolinea sp.]|nr:hypothetical protein [Chryseolinea sp.]
AKAEEQNKAFNDILNGKRLTYKDLGQELLSRNFCKSIATANRWIGDNLERGILFQEDGLYCLTPF